MTNIVIIFTPVSPSLNKIFDGTFDSVCQIGLCSSFNKRQTFDVYALPNNFRLDSFADIAFVYDGQPIHDGTGSVLEQCLNGKDVIYVSYHKSIIEEHGHRDRMRAICKLAEKYIGKDLFEIESHHNSGSIYDATQMLAEAQTEGEYNDALKAFHQAFPKKQLSTALAFLDQLFIDPSYEKIPYLPKELMVYQSAYKKFKQTSSGNYKSAFNEFRDSILAPYIQENVSERE